jgi:hypothetical protein
MASKKRKLAIELPDSYYDNPMPRKRQLRDKDEIKAGSSRGKITVYRNPKKKNITKLRPVRKNKESWTGV